jgi:CheY-like chemotaxis protein
MPTALIVDDEPGANRLLAMLVALRGYESHAAFDAAAGERLARETAPDVVLLDLMLPDRSGLEVCRALAWDPSTCRLPVVVVSARLAERSRVESLKAGACAFVPKPFTPEMIFEALTAASGWRGAIEASHAEVKVRLDATEDGDLAALALMRARLVARGSEGVAAARALAGLFEAAADPGVRVEMRLGDGQIDATLEAPGSLVAGAEVAPWLGRFDAASVESDGRRLQVSKRIRPDG